jgi:hypothetical protein
VPHVGSLNILTTPIQISDSLPPSIEKKDDRTHNGGSNGANTGRNNCGILHEFLFLWGHHWLVLMFWWGLTAYSAGTTPTSFTDWTTNPDNSKRIKLLGSVFTSVFASLNLLA